MERRKHRSDDFDPPRRSRRRAKSRGSAAVVLLVLFGVVLLGGGVAGAVLLTKYRGQATAPTPKGETTGELADHFPGSWEGDSPARPSLKVYLEVTRDRVTLTAFNTRTNEWGDRALVYTWRKVRASGDTLVVHREEVEGEKHDIEWSITFASADSMSVTSLRDGVLIANFRRVGRK